jgi:hypothetical protein
MTTTRCVNSAEEPSPNLQILAGNKQPGVSTSIPDKDKRIFSSPRGPYWLWGTLCLLFLSQRVRLIILLHLLSTSRMSGAKLQFLVDSFMARTWTAQPSSTANRWAANHYLAMANQNSTHVQMWSLAATNCRPISLM